MALRRRTIMIISVILLVVALAAAWVLLVYGPRMRFVGWRLAEMNFLELPVYDYQKEHRRIPSSLREIREWRSLDADAFHVPTSASVWRKPPTISDPEILYLPVVNWDRKAEYVIAVEPPPSPHWLASRLYVALHGGGPRTRHSVSDDELAQILARDDERRAATSQPGRWSQMPWRSLAP